MTLHNTKANESGASCRHRLFMGHNGNTLTPAAVPNCRHLACPRLQRMRGQWQRERTVVGRAPGCQSCNEYGFQLAGMKHPPSPPLPVPVSSLSHQHITSGASTYLRCSAIKCTIDLTNCRGKKRYNRVVGQLLPAELLPSILQLNMVAMSRQPFDHPEEFSEESPSSAGSSSTIPTYEHPGVYPDAVLLFACWFLAILIRRRLACSRPTEANRVQFPASLGPIVHIVFDASWRTLAQSSPSTVTADNQCAVKIFIFVHKTVESSLQVSTYEGATVAQQLAHSPPGKAYRVQSPAGSPDFRKWQSCRTIPLVSGFSRGSPIPSTPPIPAPLRNRNTRSPVRFRSIALVGWSLFNVWRISRYHTHVVTVLLNDYLPQHINCVKLMIIHNLDKTVDEGELREKWVHIEKTPASTATSATFPMCENRELVAPGIKPSSLFVEKPRLDNKFSCNTLLHALSHVSCVSPVPRVMPARVVADWIVRVIRPSSPEGRNGVTVAERLTRTPSTKAKQIQYPAESPDFRKGWMEPHVRECCGHLPPPATSQCVPFTTHPSHHQFLGLVGATWRNCSSAGSSSISLISIMLNLRLKTGQTCRFTSHQRQGSGIGAQRETSGLQAMAIIVYYWKDCSKVTRTRTHSEAAYPWLVKDRRYVCVLYCFSSPSSSLQFRCANSSPVGWRRGYSYRLHFIGFPARDDCLGESERTDIDVSSRSVYVKVENYPAKLSVMRLKPRSAGQQVYCNSYPVQSQPLETHAYCSRYVSIPRLDNIFDLKTRFSPEIRLLDGFGSQDLDAKSSPNLFAHSPTHLPNHSSTDPPTHSPPPSISPSFTHSPTRSPTHPLDDFGLPK
ncbi:hypothetical protein PR048_004743 [Dryococelus australis]|uniref:Uncharacterized protein n=1 Tax=Dryococelus australis TaxID=614101 RepID=A0ABQ9I874_9NEOP|nr:hypothetical protein PR048_004743 [Dryococelus australis]